MMPGHKAALEPQESIQDASLAEQMFETQRKTKSQAEIDEHFIQTLDVNLY